MSTIRNANTTGGGMYAPSQGINTALTNPNGITGAHQSNGAGFSGNAEHFSTGNPFKPVPQGYTPYNPALGPTQQPLPVAPPPTAPNPASPAVPSLGASAPVLNPAPGATDVFGTTEIGSGVTGGPLGPGLANGGQYDTTGRFGEPLTPYHNGFGNAPDTGGPMGVKSGGPPPGFYENNYQPTGPSPFDQYAANYSQQNPFGNNFFGGGQGGGRYGYGQGSNVSMLQALMGGGGGGYGDFLSQLLSRNYSGR